MVGPSAGASRRPGACRGTVRPGSYARVMAYDFQVTIDAADPHARADWWAETLGWEVEPADEEFIRRMIAEGYATGADTKIHNGALVWEDGAAIRPPGSAAGGPARRVLFQLVPEPKTVKNRVHLDVRLGETDAEAELARLTERGGTFLHRGRQGPHIWITMADPEGNEFCLG
jgi:Glyoxalase-like domain